MLSSLPILLSLTLRFVPVFSRALDSAPQLQDGFSRSLSSSRLASLEAQFASWNPAALGISAASPTIAAVLNASDPFSALLNTTQKSLGAQVYQCNGDLYGHQLPFRSCIDALMFLPNMVKKFSFGPKAQGQWNFEVPYRLLSGDGLCAIDLELNSNALSDKARGTDLVKAGQWLLTQCFGDHQQGGIVRNLGDKGRINLIIRTYTPNVQCSSGASSPSYGTCLNIIGKQIPNDKEVQVFGRAGGLNVRQVLPKTIVDSYTHQCQLTVNTRGPVDNAAWYDIWAAAVAIDAICGRQSQGGIAPGLGEGGNIFAAMRKYDARIEGPDTTIIEPGAVA